MFTITKWIRRTSLTVYADLTPTEMLIHFPWFVGPTKLFIISVKMYEPVAGLVCEEVTFPAAITLYVWGGAVVLQTATRAGQGLASSHASHRVHNKAVSPP